MFEPLAARSNWPPPLPASPDLSALREIPVPPWFEWSVGSVLGALAAHEQGMFYASALLSDYVLRDDRVAATLGTRVNGLLGLPFEIRPSPDGDKRSGGKVVRALEQDWPRIFSRDVIGELQRWARLMGFAVAELVWHTDGPRWVPEVKVWHPAHVWYDVTARQYVVNTMERSEHITPGDGKWLLYKPHGYYRGWMHAGIRSIAILALLRQYCLRDMGRAGELFGLGVKKGRVPVNADPADRARFKTQLARLASEGTIILPRYVTPDGKIIDFDFEWAGVDLGEGAAKLFESLAERCDTGITLTFLGQNLTTQVEGGSLAAARVHGDVRQDYLEADVQTCTGDIRSQVVRPWAAFNFGDEDCAPLPWWETTPPEDLQSAADALDSLASAIETLSKVAPEVDRRALLEKHGVPLLASQEDTTKGQILPCHLEMGIVTINEARAGLGLAPVPGGDVPPAPRASGAPPEESRPSAVAA